MHVSGNHHVEVLGGPISFLILFMRIGERGAICAMHVQRMYNSATYFQLRDGTGSETLTRDPTRPDRDIFDPLTRPGHRVSVL